MVSVGRKYLLALCVVRAYGAYMGWTWEEINEQEASYCFSCFLRIDECHCDTEGVPEEINEPAKPGSVLEWIKKVKREEGWR